jgi:hypothetical protein
MYILKWDLSIIFDENCLGVLSYICFYIQSMASACYSFSGSALMNEISFYNGIFRN